MRLIAAFVVGVVVAGGSTPDLDRVATVVPTEVRPRDLGPAATTAPASESCWVPPVDAPVIDGFRPPGCRWCAGNRGVEYGSSANDPIQSPVSGRVTFDGTVAGTRYLSVSVGVGGARLTVTLGGLSADTPRRAVGARITRGEIVGHAAGAVHLGVRLRGDYVDPNKWLDGIPGAPVLVPVDGPSSGSRTARTSCA